MSALVSLETFFFPGWPTATTPSTFTYFMALFGAPLLVFAVVAGIAIGLDRRKQVSDDEIAAGLAPNPVRPQPVTGGGARRALPADVDAQPVVATPEHGQVVADEVRGGAHAAR